jgi:hypothetical protein
MGFAPSACNVTFCSERPPLPQMRVVAASAIADRQVATLPQTYAGAGREQERHALAAVRW